MYFVNGIVMLNVSQYNHYSKERKPTKSKYEDDIVHICHTISAPNIVLG